MTPTTPTRLSGGIALGVLVAIGVLLACVDPATTSHSLPGCSFRNITGLACPGCGGTRALHAALVGDWSLSGKFNLLAIPLAILAAYPLARFAAYGLTGWQWPPLPRSKVFWLIIGGIVVAFGIARNLPGFPLPLPI